jgi:hypothetical protein
MHAPTFGALGALDDALSLVPTRGHQRCGNR